MHKIGSLSLFQSADTVRLSFAILISRKKEKMKNVVLGELIIYLVGVCAALIGVGRGIGAVGQAVEGSRDSDGRSHPPAIYPSSHRESLLPARTQDIPCCW